MYENPIQMSQMNRVDSLMSENQSEKLELFVSCRNLADLDIITVTDSFLVIKIQELNKPERKLLQTKVYWNDLNPDYAQTVTIDYYFQIRQKLKLEVYHEDKPPQLVGQIETTLGEIFGSATNGLKKALKNKKGKQRGEIIIRCEKVERANNHLLEFCLRASNLPASSGFCCFGSETSVFYRVYRVRQKDELLIYESETVFDNEHPRYRKVTLSERRLCKNNPDAKFEIRFFNYASSGNHTYVGNVITTVNSILDSRVLTIQDRKNKVKGNVKMQSIKRYIKYSFADYIGAGLQLLLINCIDFTASNGSPKFANSLHFISGNKKSQYEEALEQVSRILLDYDSDKMVPVYGFGAKCHFPTFNSFGKVHHCFPLNGNEQNAHVFMVEGIMQAYRNSLQYLEFAGPTLFSALLGQAIDECIHLQKQMNQYMILFILTDGEIHDKAQVIDQIIRCCTLPISLIIVGVGNGPFDIMNELDDDDCQLKDSRGNPTTRDLVQFVQFRKYRNNGMELAREVLEELPRQVEEYFQMVNIQPQQIYNLNPNVQMQQSMQFSSKLGQQAPGQGNYPHQ